MVVQEPLLPSIDESNTAIGDQYIAQLCGANGSDRRKVIVIDVGDLSAALAAFLDQVSWESIIDVRKQTEWQEGLVELWSVVLDTHSARSEEALDAFRGVLKDCLGQKLAPLVTLTEYSLPTEAPLWMHIGDAVGKKVWSKRRARSLVSDLCSAYNVRTIEPRG